MKENLKEDPREDPNEDPKEDPREDPKEDPKEDSKEDPKEDPTQGRSIDGRSKYRWIWPLNNVYLVFVTFPCRTKYSRLN